MNVLEQILFTAACLLLPIAWGVIVNWLFSAWRSRNDDATDDETIFPDYQI